MSIELKQAAQQAIEAIQDLRGYRPDIDKAIEALRTAIQQAEAKTDEPVDFPAGAIVNGRTLIARIEAYPFESQGGGLRMCSDWHELRRCFEHLADYVSAHPAPGVPDDVARDAERYRWLRSLEHCNEAWCFIGSGNANSDLDATIDAAMLAAK